MSAGADNALPANAFGLLARVFGEQPWWPAETAFEVLVGAVLTQNAAWRNVELALERLSAESLMSAEAILAADIFLLKHCLRPSGFYNVKTERLRAACEAWIDLGGEDGARQLNTPVLRERLLSAKGLGPESVDDVLLYGFGRAVFVVDAYTRRIFSRMGEVSPNIGYGELQDYFHARIHPDVERYRQYHGLIVTLGKHHCRPRSPRCADCPVLGLCQHGQAQHQRS